MYHMEGGQRKGRRQNLNREEKKHPGVMGAKVAPLIIKPPRVVEAPLMDFFQFLFFPGSGFFFLLEAQERGR